MAFWSTRFQEMPNQFCVMLDGEHRLQFQGSIIYALSELQKLRAVIWMYSQKAMISRDKKSASFYLSAIFEPCSTENIIGGYLQRFTVQSSRFPLYEARPVPGIVVLNLLCISISQFCCTFMYTFSCLRTIFISPYVIVM